MINLTEVIDNAIGEMEIPRLEEDKKIIASDSELQAYVTDLTYKWVIKTYLINVMLDERISEERFKELLTIASTFKGRQDLASSIVLDACRSEA